LHVATATWDETARPVTNRRAGEGRRARITRIFPGSGGASGASERFDKDDTLEPRLVAGGVLRHDRHLVAALFLHAEDGREGAVVVHVDRLAVHGEESAGLRPAADDDQMAARQEVLDLERRRITVLRPAALRPRDDEFPRLREGAFDLLRVKGGDAPVVAPLGQAGDLDGVRSDVALVEKELPEQAAARDLQAVARGTFHAGPAQGC